MSATDTTRTEAPERFVSAPKGMAWVEGTGRFPGYWERPENVGDDQAALYPEPEPGGNAEDMIVRVPADEPASKADLMTLAAEVAYMREQSHVMRTMLRGIRALLGEM